MDGHALDECQRRLSEKRNDRQRDEAWDEERADRIGHQPAKLLDEQRGDDHSDAAQGVGQNVKEHTWKREGKTS